MKAKDIKAGMIILEGANRYKVLEAIAINEGTVIKISFDTSAYPVQFGGRLESEIYVNAETQINIYSGLDKTELDRIAAMPEDELLLFAVEMAEKNNLLLSVAKS